MNELRCGARNCAANTNGLCCLGEIHVEGSSARSAADTCCASFREQGSGFSNAACCDSPKTHSDILCDVQKCRYNSNGCCCADSVEIRGAHACACGETCCKTFRE